MTRQRLSARSFAAQLFIFLSIFAGFDISARAQTLDHFEFNTIAPDKTAFVPFRVIISARSSTGALVRSYIGTPTLTATLDGFPIGVEAMSDLKFTSGQWVGNLLFTKPGDGVLLTVTGNGRSGTAGPFNVASPNFRVLHQPVISLASDTARGVLYASIGPTNAPFGSILTIDPSTGDILDTHTINGGVERLELADHGATLYVASEDQLKVRRLRLPDFEEEAAFTLGESEPGIPNYAADLAAHPTRPDVVAVIKRRRQITPWFTGLSVFEGAVEKTTPSVHLAQANVVHWGANPKRLYGYYNLSTPNNFTRYELTETNVNPLGTRWNLFTGFYGDIEFLEGKLYCSTGRILDPETLTLLGELPNGHDDAVILAQPDRKRIVFFTPDTLGLMLIYDSDTLQLLETQPFPAPRHGTSGAVSFSESGIAMHDGKRLYLTTNAIIPRLSAPADIQALVHSAPTTAEPGVDTELKASVRNNGPNASGPVLIRIFGAGTNTFVTDATVVGQNATTTIQERSAILEIPTIQSQQNVEVRFTARSGVPGWEAFAVIATSAALDPDTTNNAVAVHLQTTPPPTSDAPVVYRLGATTMVADRTRGKLIVTPTAQSAPAANTVMVIDPSTGVISHPVHVGSRPSELAISDDDQYLYVGYQGLSEVRRFKLPAIEHDLTIPLGADGFSGPYFANDIASRPNHPTEIAVARYTVSASSVNPSQREFSYFHNATEIKPDRGQPQVVRFASPDRLLTYDTSFGVHRFDVTDQSITWNSATRDINSSSPFSLAVHDGKMFFNGGPVHDATTGARLGQFNYFAPYGPGPLIDAATDRTLLVSRGISQHMVWAFDNKTYSMIDTNLLNASIGNLTGFARWSADGLALAGTTGILIFKTNLLPAPPDELRVSAIAITSTGATIQFSNLPAGQFIIEETADLSGTWSQLGDPFSESTAEIPINPSAAHKFYRLVKLP